MQQISVDADRRHLRVGEFRRFHSAIDSREQMDCNVTNLSAQFYAALPLITSKCWKCSFFATVRDRR